MAGQPNFLGNNTTQQHSDTKWVVTAKWLGVLQNAAGALAANNPKRSDGYRVLREKINCAYNGVAYTG